MFRQAPEKGRDAPPGRRVHIGKEDTHMAQPQGTMLPKDRTLLQIQREFPGEIQSAADYIGRVNRYVRARRGAGLFPVYRGEPEQYDTPCIPLIFRRDYLAQNQFFEKNLFDSMRQNELTGGAGYLTNAMDAQHGEFPSRLLDVTYNCLTALYFAVTPYYHKEETAYDEVDGMVYVVFVSEIFSPSAQNTNDHYSAIVNRDRPWLREPIFQKNHKFIDHAKTNKRMVAQQGAFILFPGDAPDALPMGMYYGLRIPAGAKKTLREELKLLFGIHTGSIYPETVNLVTELTQKSARINTERFTCANELRYTLGRLRRELDYYLDYALGRQLDPDGRRRDRTEWEREMPLILAHIERVVNDYRRGLAQFEAARRGWPAQTEGAGGEEFQAAAREYNRLVEEFARRVERCGLGAFAGGDLLIPGL